MVEFQRIGRCNLMNVKTKEVGWKENQDIQNSGIGKSQRIITVDRRQITKIRENYVAELYDRTNQPENLEFETVEEVDEDEKENGKKTTVEPLITDTLINGHLQ
jgi:hypothetical protein